MSAGIVLNPADELRPEGSGPFLPSGWEGLAQTLPPVLGTGSPPHPTTPAILRALRAGPGVRIGHVCGTCRILLKSCSRRIRSFDPQWLGGFGANPPPGPRDRVPPPNNARNTAGAARGAPTPLAITSLLERLSQRRSRSPRAHCEAPRRESPEAKQSPRIARTGRRAPNAAK